MSTGDERKFATTRTASCSWIGKLNEIKFRHVLFTLRRATGPMGVIHTWGQSEIVRNILGFI